VKEIYKNKKKEVFLMFKNVKDFIENSIVIEIIIILLKSITDDKISLIISILHLMVKIGKILYRRKEKKEMKKDL
jgi:hypothetical protein